MRVPGGLSVVSIQLTQYNISQLYQYNSNTTQYNTTRIIKKEVNTVRKMFYRYDELHNYLDIFINKLSYRPCTILVIMRDGYTKNEIETSKYHIEILNYEAESDDYVWENDWYEGQSFMAIYAIITDEDIISTFAF